MKLWMPREPLQGILRWTQRLLLALAASMLGYCAYVLVDTWAFQKAERRQLERLMPAAMPIASALPDRSPPTTARGLIGRIDIPRLGLSAIVIEGTSRTTLRHAVGHISGTALPGQSGNVGISGHRDTFFRPLRNIRQNDIIAVTTPLGEYRYRVVSTRIVNPHDIEVLDPGDNEVLTLVTCYPFYFVGAAPDRFIVRAERII